MFIPTCDGTKSSCLFFLNNPQNHLMILLYQWVEEKNITSIAFPKLGCGNGGLKWEDVKPLMDNYLKK